MVEEIPEWTSHSHQWIHPNGWMDGWMIGWNYSMWTGNTFSLYFCHPIANHGGYTMYSKSMSVYPSVGRFSNVHIEVISENMCLVGLRLEEQLWKRYCMSMGFIPWLQNLINFTFPSYFNDFDGDISQFFVHPWFECNETLVGFPIFNSLLESMCSLR